MKTADAGLHVLCFGGEDWWYHNRAHMDMQLMRQFARRGRVLYVNSVIMRKLKLGEGGMFLRRLSRKAASLRRGLVEAMPGFFVYTPLSAPVHHLPILGGLNQAALGWQVRRAARKAALGAPIVWVACPAARRAALSCGGAGLVYQRSDRYEQYPGVDARLISRLDRDLKAEAAVTFFAGMELYEEERSQCRRAYYLEHGVDYELFAQAHEDETVPEEMKGLSRPVVGFFGGMDPHTFDAGLAAAAATACGEMTFVFIGSGSCDLSGLASLPNVRIVGRRPYEQIPRYGKCFDVAIMPWVRSRWIEACNPVKLKEYLALGKPVVSTPFGELARYAGLVTAAEGAEAFAAAIRSSLAEDGDDLRRKRRQRVMGHSWSAKADEAARVILEATGG